MAADDDSTGPKVTWPTPLRCGQCQHEIPADEALHPEGQDYTLAFCSPACYALWRDEQADPVVWPIQWSLTTVSAAGVNNERST